MISTEQNKSDDAYLEIQLPRSPHCRRHCRGWRKARECENGSERAAGTGALPPNQDKVRGSQAHRGQLLFEGTLDIPFTVVTKS